MFGDRGHAIGGFSHGGLLGQFPYAIPKDRDHIRLEPWIGLEPADIARAGVGKGEELGPEFLPAFHGFREGFGFPLSEMPVHGILAEYQCQLYVRQRLQQGFAPCRRTFRARRHIATLAGTGETEAHRDDGEEAWIVKLILGDAEPVAQPLAADIIEGTAFLVGLAARSLADEQNLRCAVRLQQRFGAERQARANGAGANLTQ